MYKCGILKLSLLAGGALFWSSHAVAQSRPTGGKIEPQSPEVVNPFTEELHRIRRKSALPGGVSDLVRPENGGKLPNGTVYPQVTGDDALTAYSHSLERIVAPQQRNSSNNIQFRPQKFYVLNARQSVHVFHPHPPYDQGSIIWGYDGIYPGPTFISRYGEPSLVRIKNGLFDDPRANPRIEGQEVPGGFGDPRISTHLHNGHSGSESDGNPADIYPPVQPNPGMPEYPASILGIRFRDHHYGMFRAGLDPKAPNPNDGDVAETVSTLWYHDHSMDHTAANVYKGLVGFHLLFDEVDSGNENDPDPRALRLPSGEFDIPLLFQDKRFTPDGQLFLPRKGDSDAQSLELGFLGDVFAVNGQIQPKLTVSRRKYRFRLLNAGPSRFYKFFLTKDKVDQPFVFIGNDQSLLPEPYKIPADEGVLVSVAERADVVIDFTGYKKGDKLFLVNRLVMDDIGFGPASVITGGKFINYITLPPDKPTEKEKADYLLCFEVGDEAPDPSRVPQKLRANPELPDYAKGPGKMSPADLKARPNHRSFEFGFDPKLKWVINGRPFDPSPAGLASARIGSLDTPRSVLPGDPPDGEVWTLKHKGEWAHPVHIHLEEFQILWRKVPDQQPFNATTGENDNNTNTAGKLLLRLKIKSPLPAPGKITYQCIVHDDMIGEVTVGAAAPVPPVAANVIEARAPATWVPAALNAAVGDVIEWKIGSGWHGVRITNWAAVKDHVEVEIGEEPPPYEQTKKDVLRLDPKEEVQIFLRFRDFLGKYPIHCHNVSHEDHEMMLRFDVVGDN